MVPHCDVGCQYYLSCSEMPASLAFGLVVCIICSYSSAANRLGTSPEFNILLISSRNSSTTIYSVYIIIYEHTSFLDCSVPVYQ